MQSAAVTWYTPMTGLQATASFRRSGRGPISGRGNDGLQLRRPWIFSDDGHRGFWRGGSSKAATGRRDICVLNQARGELLFGHQAPLGPICPEHGRGAASRARWEEPYRAALWASPEDAKFASLREAAAANGIFPLANDAVGPAGNLVFLIRARTKADAITAYRTALQEIAPTVPLVLFATLREQMDAALGSQRAITLLSNVFGLLALFLSAIGIYGHALLERGSTDCRNRRTCSARRAADRP